MNKQIALLALSFALLLAPSSCSQDTTTLLTGGTWEFIDATTTSEHNDIIAMISRYSAYMADGTLVFNEDETWVADSHLLDDPSTGTWSLMGEDQFVLDKTTAIWSIVGEQFVMTYDDTGTPYTCIIDVLSKSELKYTERIQWDNLRFYYLTTSWKR